MEKRIASRCVAVILLLLCIVAPFGSAIGADGWVLDVITQKGGEGQNAPDGNFTIGEIVILTATLTFNGAPVEGILVGFSAIDPMNVTVMSRAVPTNSSGMASVNFTIPSLIESIGTWIIVSSAQAADQFVNDFSRFEVFSPTTHPPIARFVEVPHQALVHEQIFFDASLSEPGFDGDDECPIVEYRWDFGDGNLTTTLTPTVFHAYSSTGTYYVRLTVFAPGILPFIHPLYVDINTTEQPQTKTILEVPVGGYTQFVENPTKVSNVTSLFASAAVLAVAFVVITRKRNED
jgi:hypothetical protein